MEQQNTNQLIGYRIITEEKVIQEGTAYAGHDRYVRLLPGKYPILIKRDQYNKKYLCCAIDAKVEHEYFLNRIGSVTSGRTYNNVGEKTTHYWTPYAHEVALSQEKFNTYQERYNIELAKNVTTKPISESSIWALVVDGKTNFELGF